MNHDDIELAIEIIINVLAELLTTMFTQQNINLIKVIIPITIFLCFLKTFNKQ